MDLQEVANDCVGLIRGGYGIELTWQEKAGLIHYLRCFEKKSHRADFIHIKGDALHLFMIDYFGLDSFEVGYPVPVINDKKVVFMGAGLKLLAQDFYVGKESLKEYCRRNVDMWREERNFP